jgi:hypothetical protein
MTAARTIPYSPANSPTRGGVFGFHPPPGDDGIEEMPTRPCRMGDISATRVHT